MMKGIVIKEKMRGWLQWDLPQQQNQQDDTETKYFSFQIKAFTPHRWRFSAPRPFEGLATIEGIGENIPISGVLTLFLTGPSYKLNMFLPEIGPVLMVGKKQYRLRNLLSSLTTCPMVIYRNTSEKVDQLIGEAEVRYTDPIWRFPFDAISFINVEQTKSLSCN